MMRLTRCGLAALSLLVLLPVVPERAQNPAQSDEDRAYRAAMVAADQKISSEVVAHSELMKNLEYLTTRIGPRLTGSPQMQSASQWTLERFRAYGLDAHLETTQVAHAWTRGDDGAEITSPIERRVPIRSAGWSKATDGAVTGPVVFVPADTPAEAERFKDKLKGAVVCMGKPATPPSPSEAAENAYDALVPRRRGAGPPPAAQFRDRRRIGEMIAQSGAIAILRDSGKTDNLFNMGGAGRSFEPSPVPTAFISHEDYSLLYRLSQDGPVSLKIDLRGTFSSGPAPASITVAEIKGTELPDEFVIVGGHLDSWDLGQGALDNGTGAMAVLEAARALKALGWHPKRTLTFILFTGEEEGGVGVDLFLKNHAAEVPKMDAVLVHDTGTGRVNSIALEALYETGPLMTKIYSPLEEIFNLEALSTRYFGGSDHVAFLRAGVPAYFCVQSPAHYREAHHSQADTFDKAISEEINEGAAVLAAWAWNVSELSPALPHHAPSRAQ